MTLPYTSVSIPDPVVDIIFSKDYQSEEIDYGIDDLKKELTRNLSGFLTSLRADIARVDTDKEDVVYIQAGRSVTHGERVYIPMYATNKIQSMGYDYITNIDLTLIAVKNRVIPTRTDVYISDISVSCSSNRFKSDIKAIDMKWYTEYENSYAVDHYMYERIREFLNDFYSDPVSVLRQYIDYQPNTIPKFGKYDRAYLSDLYFEQSKDSSVKDRIIISRYPNDNAITRFTMAIKLDDLVKIEYDSDSNFIRLTFKHDDLCVKGSQDELDRFLKEARSLNILT